MTINPLRQGITAATLIGALAFTATVQEQATYVFTDVPASYAFGKDIS